MAELRSRLMQHLEGRKKVYFNKVLVTTKAEMIRLRDEFSYVTPRDTGAAAGYATGKEPPPYHPVSKLGLTIGKEEGQSGWQVVFTQGRGSNAKYALRNPMWEPYLKYHEFGVIANGATGGMFRVKWNEHLQRTRAAK